MRTLALTVLIGVVTLAGCAFHSLADFKRGEAGGKSKIYDGSYDDAYQSALASLESVGFQIERENPSTGEILAKGKFLHPGGLACDENLLGMYLERVGPGQTKIEIQEKFSGRIVGCENKSPQVSAEIARGIRDRKALAAAKQGTVAVQPPELLISQSDVDVPPIVKSALRKNAYAVVIGIEQYREKLPKADFADRDAKLMGEYLTKVLGYPEENVVVRLNERATRTDLVKYFEVWLRNNVDPGGSVFVYYSGHGAPNNKTGEAYLVPYDGDPAFVDSTAYPVKQLYAALEKLPAKEIMVALDSCFSGAGGRSVIAKGLRPMVISAENPILATGKTVVLAASSGDQVSSTFEEKGHGLLTYFFLKGLQGEGDLNKDGTIEMAELYEYVKPNVQRVARKQYNNEQTPQLLGHLETARRFKLVNRVTP